VATLAQQAPTPAPLAVPPGLVSHFPTRFDVVDAPEQFDRVLLIIDFPGGAWTPSHAPGGNVYVTVIDGEVSTRTAGAPGHEDAYPAGATGRLEFSNIAFCGWCITLTYPSDRLRGSASLTPHSRVVGIKYGATLDGPIHRKRYK
jgi:hypothetical protein